MIDLFCGRNSIRFMCCVFAVLIRLLIDLASIFRGSHGINAVEWHWQNEA